MFIVGNVNAKSPVSSFTLHSFDKLKHSSSLVFLKNHCLCNQDTIYLQQKLSAISVVRKNISIFYISRNQRRNWYSRMKITNLNIDCLERILDYLEFQDLINAAASNKRINHAAKFIFDARKYNESKLCFKVFLPVSNSTNQVVIVVREGHAPPFLISPKRIEIHELKMALRLVRCFGDMLNKVELIFQGLNHDQYIAFYIGEFCAESITKIGLSQVPAGGLDHFKKRFTKIEKVRFDTYPCQPKVATGFWINRLFPKMRKLKVSSIHTCATLFENGDTVNHLPCLEHLIIRKEIISRDECVCRENIINTLKLNPQLKKLQVKCNHCSVNQMLNGNFFRNVEDSLQNLESLEFTMDINTFLHNFKSQAIQLKNVKYLHVEHDFPSAVETFNFPFLFRSLETLRCVTEFIEYCHSFIEKHPKISTLYLTTSILGLDQDVNIDRFKEIFPSVTRVECDKLRFVLALGRSLKNFTLHLNDVAPMHSVLESVQSHFNEDWTLSIDKKHNFYTGNNVVPSSYCITGVKIPILKGFEHLEEQ
ncbi:uncharacterized protein LOC129568257 [Sitodiplosis mosellana]|uniref:uncharacterized protein LOC129568257 n=1 Tax=Sitodiplosis mosellana TaxID=263140 RepID=UPI002444433C|nr:uncharacterized protein LOC129568257 [Sitodiplosis mosellana]